MSRLATNLHAKRRSGWISIWVLASISLLLLLLSAWLFWVDHRVFVIGEQSEAVVLSKREVNSTSRAGASGRSVTEYQVRFRFRPPGGSSIVNKQAVSPDLYQRLRPGKRTPVWFDPTEPKLSYIDRRARWNALICLLIALGFAAGTIYCIRYQSRSASKTCAPTTKCE